MSPRLEGAFATRLALMIAPSLEGAVATRLALMITPPMCHRGMRATSNARGGSQWASPCSSSWRSLTRLAYSASGRYANGASGRYIGSLGVPVRLAKTGVKFVHHVAIGFDVSVYFEANGHGTMLFSDAAVDAILAAQKAANESADVAKAAAASRLLAGRQLINQAIGDALSDMLLVEAILSMKGVHEGALDWAACLILPWPSSPAHPLPACGRLAVVAQAGIWQYGTHCTRTCHRDRRSSPSLTARRSPPPMTRRRRQHQQSCSQSSTGWRSDSVWRSAQSNSLAQHARPCARQSGLTRTGDAVPRAESGRCFVRPSGTEDVVRVYAEASTQAKADELALLVAQLTWKLAGGVGDMPTSIA